MITTGVMKVADYEDAVFYRVACDCTDADHDVTIELEYDKDFNNIYLNFYRKARVWSIYWESSNVFKRIYGRFKSALKILVSGVIEYEDELNLSNPEHVRNFISALEAGLEKLSSRYH